MESKATAQQRKIGKDNVSAIGYGALGLSAFYFTKEDITPEQKEKNNLAMLTHAADSGCTFWDTSDFYGPFTNEELIGRWFKATGRRKEIFLCTKFGMTMDPVTKARGLRSDREHVLKACQDSLKRLQTDYIDLYYQHRVDPKTKIEETVEAMTELVKEGKVRYLGLSECSATTLRRAHEVHPIAAVQLEYSLFSLDVEREEIGLKKVCEELGIALVAYSPLGRGLLSGQIKSRSDLTKDDIRLTLPRFFEENFDNNLKLVEKVEKLAKEKGCTPSQLALAWLLQQGDNIIPIPGTRNTKYFDDNWGALKVSFSSQDLKDIREVAEKAEVKGARYPPGVAANTFADSI